MALSNDPVFPQTPKTAGITFAAASQDVQMEPSSVAPATLVTAGADGALVTSVVVFPESTATAEKIVLWLQPLGTGNWYPVRSDVIAAYTQAATDAQPIMTLVDKSSPDSAIRLAGTDKLGVTHHVDQQSTVVAEFTDF